MLPVYTQNAREIEKKNSSRGSGTAINMLIYKSSPPVYHGKTTRKPIIFVIRQQGS